MLFGRYPFCDRTLMGLFMKIGRCRPDIPRTISLKARSLLRSLIRMKPTERLAVKDILGHVWFNGERDYSQPQTSHSEETANAFHLLSNNDENDAVVPDFDDYQ